MKKTYQINGFKVELDNFLMEENRVQFVYNEKKYEFSLEGTHDEQIFLNSHGQRKSSFIFNDREEWNCYVEGIQLSISKDRAGRKGRDKSKTQNDNMSSPMPGKILKIMAVAGQKVKAGDPLVVMEAMKMEHTIKATKEGVISQVNCTEGELVDGGIELVILKEE